MKPFDTIIFDLDGTLTDSGPGVVNSIKHALTKFDIDIPEDEKLYRFIGTPLVDSFKKYYSFSNEQAELAVKYYREYFTEKGIYENSLYPGIHDLLKNLHEFGCCLNIATLKPKIYTDRVLQHFGIADYFTHSLGPELDETQKDKIQIISELLTLLNQTNKNRCVMIGDTKYDVLAARQNGIYSIAVTYGYGSNDELIAASPDFLAFDVDVLAGILLDGS